MITKLRKKIFWIIQISLTIIILGIIIIFSSTSYRNTITSATMLMDRIDVRDETKDERPKDFMDPKIDTDPFSVNFEGMYRVEVNNGNIIKESEDVSEEIRNYAIEVSNKNREDGCIGNYIYKIRKVGNNGKEITLMENEDVISRLKYTIISAVIIGALGILVVYVLAKKISKIIVKPVEDSFEKQKQFVSDASHELKTPLAVIEANADVLHDKVGESKWISYIQNEVRSMNKLVNDLLTLAKMEQESKTSYNRFDLSKEVEMTVAVFESMIYEKKIKLETNIKSNVEFYGDKEDIKQVVSILIDNAIKHTEAEKRIIVDLLKDKNDIIINIKNEGKEIPKEEQEKIFERFYRVDKARNRAEKRYGLGLAIAKQLVERYKGYIQVNCKDGITTFSVKFSSR